MILKAINERLNSSAELIGIIGDRIYPISIPEKISTPAVAFNSTSKPNYTRSGRVLTNDEAEIMVISKDVSELEEVTRVVELLFDNFYLTTDSDVVVGSHVSSIVRRYDHRYDEYMSIINVEIKSKIIN